MEKFQTLFLEPTYLPTLYAINIIHLQLHRDLDRKQPRTQAPHLIVSGEPGDEARQKVSQSKTVIASITYMYVCMYVLVVKSWAHDPWVMGSGSMHYSQMDIVQSSSPASHHPHQSTQL